MSVRKKFEAGGPFPRFTWPCVDGGSITPAEGKDWRMLVVYRGAHCPICVDYLHQLGQLAPQFADLNVRLWALSADPLDRASSQAAQEKWNVTILAELQEEQMRELGLYVSSPRSPGETDRSFAEPAAFVINQQSNVQIIDVSNAPFARPDATRLLGGIKYVVENGYPIRGTVS